MKISVLFKPTKSWINHILTSAWFYEYDYNEIYNIDLTCSQKIKIDWVPQVEIWELYDYLQKKCNTKCIAVIMVNISELFW